MTARKRESHGFPWWVFRRHGPPYSGQNADLTEKTAVVTGANVGLGYHTALQLAKQGAQVYLACRNRPKTDLAIKSMLQECPNGDFKFLQLDLQDMHSCLAAAKELRARHEKVDILVNNAGILMPPFQHSKQGIESQFATNHLGHFVLTQLLLPSIATGGRIINVSSDSHARSYKEGILPLEDLNNPEKHSPFSAYGQSKLANILYTRGLANRLQRKIYVNAIHPGFVYTTIHRHIDKTLGSFLKFVFEYFLSYFSISPTPAQGAYTQLWASTSPEVVEQDLTGEFFVPMAKLAESSALGEDDEMADRLWEMSLKLVEEHLGEHVAEQCRANLSQ